MSSEIPGLKSSVVDIPNTSSGAFSYSRKISKWWIGRTRSQLGKAWAVLHRGVTGQV